MIKEIVKDGLLPIFDWIAKRRDDRKKAKEDKARAAELAVLKARADKKAKDARELGAADRIDPETYEI